MRRPLAALAALPVLTALLSPAAPAAADISFPDAEVVPIQVTGDPSERFTMIILGDGYTEEEMPLFQEQLDQHLNVQWSIEPFRSYRNYVNVYAVQTPSAESGVDCDPALDEEQRDTALDMGFFNGCDPEGLERLLSVDEDAAEAAADLVPGVSADNRQILALANSETYGGRGGTTATASSGNSRSALVSPHELAHSLGELQDEYPYYFPDESLGRYPGDEPESVHHTLMSSEEMIEQQEKWWRWLGEESEAGGTIRAADPEGHEGGLYYSEGVWRPSEHSMLKTLGYYFDQVAREVMTQRISGLRDRGELPVSSTPEGEVGPEDVVWVEGPHPLFHELEYTWSVDGEELPDAEGSRSLELAELDLAEGAHVSVQVQDPTEFVRDPQIRESEALTQTRSWTVGEPLPADAGTVEFTRFRDTERAVGGAEVVYAETSRPTDRVLEVSWTLDGEEVSTSADGRALDLGEVALDAGTHTLNATVTDPADPGGASETLTWEVDNTAPTAPRELSEPAAGANEEDHYIHLNELSLRLDPSDDGEGHVVGEFRVNEDGWHHYYGWPDDSDAPFRLSPDGTIVNETAYGSLGSGGLSMALFETEGQEPGWGTHTVEHRAIDAASNIGSPDSFRTTVVPADDVECAETITEDVRGGLSVDSGVVCLDGVTVSGGVDVAAGASLVVDGGSVRGGLTAEGADTVRLMDTEVNGAVSIGATTTEVMILGSSVSGSMSLHGNTQVPSPTWSGDPEGYGPVLAGNSFRGSLSCTDNNRAVADFGATNDVTGSADGQCAEL